MFSLHDFLLASRSNESPALGSSGKGYFAGGNTGPVVAKIEELDFPTESISVLSAVLGMARYWLIGVNSGIKGYFAGGDAAQTNYIDGLDFVSKAAIIVSAILSMGRRQLSSVKSLLRGYFCGGLPGSNGPSFWFCNVLDGIQFNTESAFTLTSVLPIARHGLAGVSSSTKGYLAGGAGEDANYVTWYNYIDVLHFDTETCDNNGLRFVGIKSRINLSSVSSSTKGYFAGGAESDGVQRTVTHITFSTEATGAHSYGLVSKQEMSAGVNSSTDGYIGGGNWGGPSNAIETIEFSTETITVLSATLATATYGLAGVSYL